jgi:aminoglycoside/choline kinase family phosphotransferase
LIYDPYVSLSLSEREELIEYYQASAHQEGLELSGNFEEILNLCAMQRLMQALGAYGFLGIQKQRRHFLDHIPVAGQSLTQVLSRMDGMDALSARLDSALQHLPAR